MNLRGEFESAWKAGGDYRFLAELVHRYQRQTPSAGEAYATLQQLWLDNGFDDGTYETPLQDKLEYVWKSSGTSSRRKMNGIPKPQL